MIVISFGGGYKVYNLLSGNRVIIVVFPSFVY